MRNNTRRYVYMSMLLAMAIVLNIVEGFIPMFIPGVKLGLANIIVLIMIYDFKFYEALLMMLLRIFLVGLLRGNLLTPTWLMSLSGGTISFFVMYLFSKLKFFSPIGVSTLGALSHATGQVLIAIILLETSLVIYYLPLIGILSTVTGIFTGIIVCIYLKRNLSAAILNKKNN